MVNTLFKKLSLLFLLISIFSGCAHTETQKSDNSLQKKPDIENTIIYTPPETNFNLLNVHYIDVGQADCILLDSSGHYMLIDAGNNDDADLIIDYLQKEGVEKLDYVFGTHPHEDHIGSLDTVINEFDIDNIYMPKKEHTSKTFEDVLTAILEKDMKVTAPVSGETIDFNGVKVEILAPVKEYDDLNNNSIILKVTSGNISFLFTGDAEAESENDILSKNFDLDSDILKVGHHGSDTSTTEDFLDSVSPGIAIISVGADNSYGHPDKTTIEKLNKRNIEIYRTDLNGTIIISTDGETISINFDKKEGSKKQNFLEADEQDILSVEHYIGNINSKKFHLSSCSSLPIEKNQVYFNNRNAAINEGYIPCKRCNP